MLVDTWLRAEKAINGLNEKDSRELMNQALGTNYTHGNVNWWKKGRQPQKDVHLYMLGRCFHWWLEHELPRYDIPLESDVEQLYHQIL